jgi:hypothetical protein
MAGKKLVTSILVADDNKARIFRNLSPDAGLTPILEKQAGPKHKAVKLQKIQNKVLLGLFSSDSTVKKTTIGTVLKNEDFIPWISNKINSSGGKNSFDFWENNGSFKVII